MNQVHIHMDHLENKLQEQNQINEAQEISNKNNIKIDELQKTFQQFGLHTQKYRADKGKGHKGLNGHTGRLHVFTGGSENEHALYMVFSFDHTGLKEQVWYGSGDFIEPAVSKNQPVYESRNEGKIEAMKKAIQYGCINILDKDGYIKDEEFKKRFR